MNIQPKHTEPLILSGRDVTALLGPTNTGKTHRAVERMLEHASGMIGLPLRLLAREVYDRIRAKRSALSVALVTGEEKQRFPRAVYWVCTVEAMPVDNRAVFLAVDEVQLAARASAATSSPPASSSARGRDVVPRRRDHARVLSRARAGRQIVTHPRLSRSRMPARAAHAPPPTHAVVAFSAAGLRDRRADPPPQGRRCRRPRRALAAHAQRAGRDVPGRRGRLARRDRRHRHGTQPR